MYNRGCLHRACNKRTFFKSQLTLGINTWGYILIREEVFCLTLLTFLFSSYSSQRNTHSPLSKEKGITKKKKNKNSLCKHLWWCVKNKSKINISVITALCENSSSPGPTCNRHNQEPWSGGFPAPGLELPGQRSPWSQWDLGLFSSPHCPSGCMPMLSAQFSKPAQSLRERDKF